MSDESRRMPLTACRVLGAEPSSIPVEIVGVKRAEVVWSETNSPLRAKLAEIAAHLADGGTRRAWADRYGGAGIGGNGGSGRAGLFGDTYLKGIGPTPLIGRTTNSHHISGGAYLEECVRETVFAQVFAHELPWGAVTTRGIIDIFDDQHWAPDPESDFPVASERRVLLAREPIIRVAHLQRAVHFTGDYALTGASDIKRVEQNIASLVSDMGREALRRRLHQFWLRWCDQCAYLYVWRLTQGAPSTSNICMDGRLLDFGAASSLPDWCSTVVFSGAPESGNDLPQIMQFMWEFYAEHRESGLALGTSWTEYLSALQAECHRRYYRLVGVEMLRLAGLRRAGIDDWVIEGDHAAALEAAVVRVTRRFARLFKTTIEAEKESADWDFPAFWSDCPPSHYLPLRHIAEQIASTARGEPIRERMKARCSRRGRLSREIFRRRLHNQLSNPAPGARTDATLVSNIISEEVVAARRDTYYEPRDDVPHGFALAGSVSYALFRQPDGAIYAVAEPPVMERRENDVRSPTPVCTWTERGQINDEVVDAVHIFDEDGD